MPIYPVQYASYPIAASPAFPNGRTAKRPVLRLAIANGDQSLDCYAIVDSGADNCCFPSSFATALGFDVLTGNSEPCSGMGSVNIPTHFWNITLDLQGVTQYQVYAGFTDGLEGWGIGLLGQTGFFDRFKVYFDHSAALYHVEIQPPPAPTTNPA